MFLTLHDNSWLSPPGRNSSYYAVVRHQM